MTHAHLINKVHYMKRFYIFIGVFFMVGSDNIVLSEFIVLCKPSSHSGSAVCQSFSACIL